MESFFCLNSVIASFDVNEICFSVMSKLVENGADINFQNNIGKTA